jgi:hypothetical protein
VPRDLAAAPPTRPTHGVNNAPHPRTTACCVDLVNKGVLSIFSSRCKAALAKPSAMFNWYAVSEKLSDSTARAKVFTSSNRIIFLKSQKVLSETDHFYSQKGKTQCTRPDAPALLSNSVKEYTHDFADYHHIPAQPRNRL